MKYLKLYEEFILNDKQVLEPTELVDNPVDDSLLGGDNGSYIDASGIIHIKNWNEY